MRSTSVTLRVGIREDGTDLDRARVRIDAVAAVVDLAHVREAGLVHERHVGDVVLALRGCFSLDSRKLVDIDYHRDGRPGLRHARRGAHRRERARCARFAELATKFQPMVDALNGSASSYQHPTRIACDCTAVGENRGERSRQLLRKLGLEPAPAARSVLAH
jgi:hypothetical protein